MIRNFIGGPSKAVLITAKANVGKNQVMQQIVVECVLPLEWNGSNCDVILIDTTKTNAMLPQILRILEKHIRYAVENISENDITKRARELLRDRLSIYRIYSLDELISFRHTLISILRIRTEADQPVVVILDCLTTFYWSCCSAGLYYKRLTYVKKVYRSVREICRGNCQFISGCRLGSDIRMPVDRIHLEKFRGKKRIGFKASFYQDNAIKKVKYGGFTDSGIVWIK